MKEVRKSITALYHEFELAPQGGARGGRGEGGHRSRQVKIAAAIVKLPAENIDEMVLKIRVALRCAGALRSGELLTSIDHWKAGEPSDHRPDYESEQFDCLCSLRDDLSRTRVDRPSSQGRTGPR